MSHTRKPSTGYRYTRADGVEMIRQVFHCTDDQKHAIRVAAAQGGYDSVGAYIIDKLGLTELSAATASGDPSYADALAEEVTT